MSRKKLSGGKAFDSLLRKLVQVPKKEVDREARKHKARRARRRK